MPFHYRKQIKLSKRTKLNLSKSGPSLSIGLGRLSFNLSKRGVKTSLRLAKGLVYRFRK